jgi:hypothetical protein
MSHRVSPDQKIFFSYSRLDSDFAMRLAQDIRKAGTDIWIDQLDIPPGVHWDEAVEEALNDAGSVLVILSPASIASDNVMDEISFALDTGKTIIPIIWKPCKTPFRLRRWTRIDFSKNYFEGLQKLLETAQQRVATTGPIQSMVMI